MIRNLKVAHKLLLGFSVPFLAMCLFAAGCYLLLGSVKERSRHAQSESVVFAQIASEMRLQTVEIQQWFSDVGATRGQDGLDDGFVEAEQSYQAFQENLAKFRDMYTREADHASLKELDALARLMESYYGSGKAMAEAYVSGGPAAGNSMMGSFDDAAEELKEKLNPFVEQQLGELDRSLEEVTESADQVLAGVLVLIASSLLVLCGVVYGLTRAITGPIRHLGRVANEVSAGNLDTNVEVLGKDEFGDLAGAFRLMTSSLREKADASERISKGDFTVEVRTSSNRDRLGYAMQGMIATIRDMDSEVQHLVAACREGRLEARGDARKFTGAFNQIVDGLNAVLETVTTPLHEAITVSDRLAARDLTARLQGDYRGEFARFKGVLNSAVENLADALTQVSAASAQVSSAAGQISSGSQSLSQGASEQASSLEEVSASLQEVSSMAVQNAANAKEARSLSEAARQSAQAGVQSMQRLSTSINKIKSSADATAKILKTIDEIAFQTNLLALNAAVEAARAGDAGKGFAVVAEEVRNLAMRSAEAARNTATLIEESVGSAGEGVVLTEEALDKLEEIHNQVNQVGAVMNEITVSSEQQKEGVEQVNTAIEQLNLVTQQTAASSEESASASEELEAQAEEMNSLVASFTLDCNAVAPLRAESALPPRLSQAAPIRRRDSGQSRPARRESPLRLELTSNNRDGRELSRF